MEKDYNAFDHLAYIVLQSSPVRNSWETALLVTVFALVLALGLAGSVSFAFLLGKPSLAGALSRLPDHPWWFIYRDPGPRDPGQPLAVIAAAVAATVLGLGVSFRTQRLHRHDGSHVLPYMLLFFLTLGIECLRGVIGVLYATGSGISAAILLTRAVYWGRFVGLFALLLASLYCIDLKYRRVYVLGGGTLLVAFAMAASIPLDSSTFLSQLLWKLGDEQGVWFVDVVISVLVLATTIGAAALKKDRRFFVLAAGFLLLLAARQLLFFSVRPLLLASGFVVLTVGAVLCLQTLTQIYGRTWDGYS